MEIVVEFFMELFFEVIVEGIMEGSQNKRIPAALRAFCKCIIAAFLGGMAFLFLMLAIQAKNTFAKATGFLIFFLFLVFFFYFFFCYPKKRQSKTRVMK